MRTPVRLVWAAALALVTLAAPLAAQPADSLLAEARAATAAGRPGEAFRLAGRGLSAAPDDAALLTLRLELELAGEGLAGVPGPFQRQQQRDTARRLLAVAPGSPLAHDVLGRAALRDFLFFRHMVNIPVAFSGDAETFDEAGVSPQYVRARFRRGRFDVDALREVFRASDASGPSRAAERDARHHLEAALSTDPAYRSAYTPLLALYTATGAWTAASAAAEQAQALFPADPAPLLWAGLAQYRLGNPDAAEASFGRARALLPSDARARFDDLTPLLTPDEAVRYRDDPGGFARAYWARQDVRLLTPANERRSEHDARVTEAGLVFGWNAAAGAETDRGRVWARYGTPIRRTLISGQFYQGDEPFDLYEVWEYDGFRFVFEDPNRSGEFRTYSPAAQVFSDVAVVGQAESDDYVALDRRLQREAPQLTQHTTARRERVPFLATAFRGTRGRTDLVVAYGVPVSGPPGVAVPLAVETGVFALGPAGPPVAERRRSRPSLQAADVVAGGGATLWAGSETLALVPGPYTVAAEFDAAGGTVAGYERTEVAVPDFSGTGLRMSGLLLAHAVAEGGAGPLQRRGFGILPAPLAAFDADRLVHVYAEAYGLRLGPDGRTAFEVEGVLVPTDGRSPVGRAVGGLFGRTRDRGVSVAFEGSGTDVEEVLALSFDAAGQAPGRYTLALRVRDLVAGTTAETARELSVE